MSDSEGECDEKLLKIAVVGDQEVGKTNLIKKFCHDEFSRLYFPTIGADFYSKRVKLGGNDVILRITDVSGSEIGGHMLSTYLFKSDVVVLVYDITLNSSFELLVKWLRKVDQMLNFDDKQRGTSIAVLANKCDLEHKRTVKLDAANHFSEDNKIASYYVSAKTGENVHSSFIDILAKYLNLPMNNLEKEKQTFILNAELTVQTPPESVNKSRKLGVNGAPENQSKVRKHKKLKMISSQSCILQ